MFVVQFVDYNAPLNMFVVQFVDYNAPLNMFAAQFHVLKNNCQIANL